MTAISFFSRMELFSVAAKKSGDVVSKLLNAAKSAAKAADAQRRQHDALMKVMLAQREQQRGQQQKQQQHQHTKQQLTSHPHPHPVNLLAMQSMKNDELHSPLSSPIDTFSQTLSPTPSAFNSVQITMPGVLSPAQSISSRMSPSSLTPTTDFSGLNLHVPANHPPQPHPSAMGGLSGIPNITDPGVMAMQQGHGPQMGFWDDMMWDSYPEVENQSFASSSQWNAMENPNGINTHIHNHTQWGYSTS
jgi:hypothetical protein